SEVLKAEELTIAVGGSLHILLEILLPDMSPWPAVEVFDPTFDPVSRKMRYGTPLHREDHSIAVVLGLGRPVADWPAVDTAPYISNRLNKRFRIIEYRLMFEAKELAVGSVPRRPNFDCLHAVGVLETGVGKKALNVRSPRHEHVLIPEPYALTIPLQNVRPQA